MAALEAPVSGAATGPLEEGHIQVDGMPGRVAIRRHALPRVPGRENSSVNGSACGGGWGGVSLSYTLITGPAKGAEGRGLEGALNPRTPETDADISLSVPRGAAQSAPVWPLQSERPERVNWRHRLLRHSDRAFRPFRLTLARLVTSHRRLTVGQQPV